MRCTPLRSNPSARWAATRLRALLAVVLGVGLGACGSGETGNGGDDVVARAFDKTLGVADLASRIPDDALPEDSIAMAQRIIDTWIREQVLVHQAINSLPEDLQNFDAEIETYRNALLLHRYEELYVSQRLQTEVSKEEAFAFYELHPELFTLNDYVVQAQFFHLPLEEPLKDREIAQLKRLLSSTDSQDLLALETWCLEHQAVFHLDPETWWSLDDLLQEVPLELYRPESQIADRRTIEFEQNGRRYFLRFLRHNTKGMPAPFPAVRDRVEELIRHQRRNEILSNLTTELVEGAKEDGDVEQEMYLRDAEKNP
jgi:hypothetical protein